MQPINLLKRQPTCPTPVPVWFLYWPQLPRPPTQLWIFALQILFSTSERIFERQRLNTDKKGGGRITLAERIKMQNIQCTQPPTERGASWQLCPGRHYGTVPQIIPANRTLQVTRAVENKLTNDNYFFIISDIILTRKISHSWEAKWPAPRVERYSSTFILPI